MAEQTTSRVNAVAVAVAVIGGTLLLLGWLFQFPW